MPQDFTLEHLRQSCVELMQMAGTKPFWALDTPTRKLAVDGLMHIYMHTPLTKEATSAFSIAIDDYTRRAELLNKEI